MELECDGTGEAVYYDYGGKRLLLCETPIPHRHCLCGEPIPKSTSFCAICLSEQVGARVHNPEGFIRETREHQNTHAEYFPNQWLARGNAEVQPVELDPHLPE